MCCPSMLQAIAAEWQSRATPGPTAVSTALPACTPCLPTAYPPQQQQHLHSHHQRHPGSQATEASVYSPSHTAMSGTVMQELDASLLAINGVHTDASDQSPVTEFWAHQAALLQQTSAQCPNGPAVQHTSKPYGLHAQTQARQGEAAARARLQQGMLHQNRPVSHPYGCSTNGPALALGQYFGSAQYHTAGQQPVQGLHSPWVGTLNASSPLLAGYPGSGGNLMMGFDAAANVTLKDSSNQEHAYIAAYKAAQMERALSSQFSTQQSVSDPFRNLSSGLNTPVYNSTVPHQNVQVNSVSSQAAPLSLGAPYPELCTSRHQAGHISGWAADQSHPQSASIGAAYHSGSQRASHAAMLDSSRSIWQYPVQHSANCDSCASQPSCEGGDCNDAALRQTLARSISATGVH